MKYAYTVLSCMLILFLTAQSQTNFWESLTLPANPQWGGQPVWSIACNSSGHVFAASAYGVIRSLDQGATWTKVLSTGGIGLAITSNGTVFTGGAGGIMRSTDNGESWQPMNSGLPTIIAASIAAKDDGHIVVGSLDGSVFRSSDGGQSWQKVRLAIHISDYFLTMTLTANGNIVAGCTSGRFYMSSTNGKSWSVRLITSRQDRIVVTANSAGEVFAGGQSFVSSQSRASIYRSSDNGRHFRKIAVFPGEIFRSIVSDPSGNVFLGSESGVYVSSDHGTTWNQKNSGLADNIMTAMQIGPEGFVYTGAGLGAIYRSMEVVPPSNAPRGVEECFPEVSRSFTLDQNYPNPFNPTTTISFELKEEALVTLKVFNTLGQEVKELIHNELLDEGMQEVELDASSFASGVYYYRIIARDIGRSSILFHDTRKMLFVK